VRWRLIYQHPSSRHPDSVIDKYSTTALQFLNKNTRRIVWIKSSQKAEADRIVRSERIQNSFEALKILNTKINRRKLKRRRDIQRAVRQILQEHKTTRLFRGNWISASSRPLNM